MFISRESVKKDSDKIEPWAVVRKDDRVYLHLDCGGYYAKHCYISGMVLDAGESAKLMKWLYRLTHSNPLVIFERLGFDVSPVEMMKALSMLNEEEICATSERIAGVCATEAKQGL